MNDFSKAIKRTSLAAILAASLAGTTGCMMFVDGGYTSDSTIQRPNPSLDLKGKTEFYNSFKFNPDHSLRLKPSEMDMLERGRTIDSDKIDALIKDPAYKNLGFPDSIFRLSGQDILYIEYNRKELNLDKR